MKCKYHAAAEAEQLCRTCNRPLCVECAHQIKGKYFCQDCLVQGAEWAAAFKDLRLPADSPKRAALVSLIPGMGAVYNNEYIKALTFFAVFALLIIMSDRVHEVFGVASFAFVIFTMFDSYRTAEAKIRASVEGSADPKRTAADKMTFGWGIFLICLGVLFLLQNIIPFHFLNRLWPLMFILLGVYLVHRFIQDKHEAEKTPMAPAPGVERL